MLLTRPMLDARRFPPEQLDALFQAVLVDDEVDAHTALPARIALDHDEALLADCLRICRQLWREGADPDGMRHLLGRLWRDGDLDAADRAHFKRIRAKLKHFRFAFALYGADHRYPRVTDWMTTALGHLQDAYKTGQPARVRRHVLIVRALLSPAAQAQQRREHDRIVLTDTAGFRVYLARETIALAGLVAHAAITGAEFHAGRKVASRQVSFYDTMRTVRPTSDALLMSRSLAAINGLMGDMHDRLVERRVAGVQDYHRERFALPVDIGDRIVALVDRYRASGLAV